MNFGNNLKDLRETRNVTQGQLAEYLQVSRPTIAGYETKSRQPDFEKLEKLANYFHVSIDYLVSGSESRAHLAVFTSTALCSAALAVWRILMLCSMA